MTKPQWFYWRAWEFIEEISYNIPHKQTWKGYEMGDLERSSGKRVLEKHFEWQTEVSCDKHGARRVPFNRDFVIAFGGDSQTWGSGLSDRETIPWRVAETLSVPVYNGAKFPFKIEQGLNHTELSHVKIVIETPVREHLESHKMDKKVVLRNLTFKEYMHECPGETQKSLFHYSLIHPKRYFLLAKPLRLVSLSSIAHSLCIPLFRHFKMEEQPLPEIYSEEGIRLLAHLAIQRSRAFNQLGYHYIFSMIPGKQVMANLGEETNRLSDLFSSILQAGGVHYIDLMKAFKDHPLKDELYISTDTHLNPYGAELVSEKISEYLETHFHDVLEGSRNRHS